MTLLVTTFACRISLRRRIALQPDAFGNIAADIISIDDVVVRADNKADVVARCRVAVRADADVVVAHFVAAKDVGQRDAVNGRIVDHIALLRIDAADEGIAGIPGESNAACVGHERDWTISAIGKRTTELIALDHVRVAIAEIDRGKSEILERQSAHGYVTEILFASNPSLDA
jgi:hypothetical protein